MIIVFFVSIFRCSLSLLPPLIDISVLTLSGVEGDSIVRLKAFQPGGEETC